MQFKNEAEIEFCYRCLNAFLLATYNFLTTSVLTTLMSTIIIRILFRRKKKENKKIHLYSSSSLWMRRRLILWHPLHYIRHRCNIHNTRNMQLLNYVLITQNREKTKRYIHKNCNKSHIHVHYNLSVSFFISFFSAFLGKHFRNVLLLLLYYYQFSCLFLYCTLSLWIILLDKFYFVSTTMCFTITKTSCSTSIMHSQHGRFFFCAESDVEKRA